MKEETVLLPNEGLIQRSHIEQVFTQHLELLQNNVELSKKRLYSETLHSRYFHNISLQENNSGSQNHVIL